MLKVKTGKTINEEMREVSVLLFQYVRMSSPVFTKVKV